MSRIAACTLALALACAAARPARADIQVRGPEVWPGKSEVSAHLGFQAGLSGYSVGGGPPAGFRFTGAYNFRFYDAGLFTLWLDVGFGLTVGGSCNTSAAGFGRVYACGAFSTGSEIQPLAGVKLKFRTPIPLVPYARLDAFFSYIFNRYCDDNGFAVGARAAGGAQYFLTRNLGVGLESGFTLGPSFYPNGAPDKNVGCYTNSYTYPPHNEFYGAFDLVVGGSYVFNGL